jgi:hypothetical protein
MNAKSSSRLAIAVDLSSAIVQLSRPFCELGAEDRASAPRRAPSPRHRSFAVGTLESAANKAIDDRNSGNFSMIA